MKQFVKLELCLTPKLCLYMQIEYFVEIMYFIVFEIILYNSTLYKEVGDLQQIKDPGTVPSNYELYPYDDGNT